MREIAVIGAGAFGTALANVHAAAGRKVWLWGRDRDHIGALEVERCNRRYLAGIDLHENLQPTFSLKDIQRAEALILSVPAQQTSDFLEQNGSALPKVPLVLTAKGIGTKALMLQDEIARVAMPELPNAVLTGPGFAGEIARLLPTALTLACVDEELSHELQRGLATPSIRLYRTTDVKGAQLGGALKNVVAIACGMAIGAGLGESARAALMTRGFAEMVRLGEALGADRETFTGLSGLGDLALTCGTEQSRNFAAGLALGKAGAVREGETIEGIATATATMELAQKLGVEMPIATAVAGVLEGRISLREAVTELLSRPLTTETDA
jgi:glycerol-3-phosphate dehydrogenase (NAD(P)+)